MRESAVAGTLLTYAATAANYGLAVAYVVLLTRFVPLEDYGHYNALAAAAGLLGLLFPTLGVDDAIAREGAAAAARGQTADKHAAAIALVALAVGSAYAAALAAVLPHSAPPHLAPIAYLMAANALLGALATALEVQLWMEGRLATRGRGLLIPSLPHGPDGPNRGPAFGLRHSPGRPDGDRRPASLLPVQGQAP